MKSTIRVLSDIGYGTDDIVMSAIEKLKIPIAGYPGRMEKKWMYYTKHQ
ncbi:MAG: hypothetical protein IPJ13_20515 [Saprospiraceae bacterium]|nr:hypothetical protein [Saprospiraceae bacterium]